MSVPHACNAVVSLLRRSRRLAATFWGIVTILLAAAAGLTQWLVTGNLEYVLPPGLAALALCALAIGLYLGYRQSDNLLWAMGTCRTMQDLKDTAEDPERLVILEQTFENHLNRPLGGVLR